MKEMTTISFRPTKHEEEAFEKAAQTLGVSRSELMREIFWNGFERGVATIQYRQKQKMEHQLKLLKNVKPVKMVRDAGIEPATPTVSRESSPQQLAVLNTKTHKAKCQLPSDSPASNYSPSQAAILPPSISETIIQGVNIGEQNAVPRLPFLGGRTRH